MDLDTYIINLTKLQEQFTPMLLNKIKGKAAFLVLEPMAKRVQQKGENATGGKFSPYSTKPTLSSGKTPKGSTVWRELAGSKEKRKELEWVTVKGRHLFIIKGGYKEIRKIEGLETSFKNYTFTGEMFKQILVTKETQDTDSTIVVTISANEANQQKKLNWTSENEGISIIALNKAEQKAYNDFVHTCADELLSMK
jgi:hypothetical protein